jgi:tetratricopeptide (TPR) repeat protein
MAQHRLGQAEAAGAALGTAQAIIATKMPDAAKGRLFGHDWHDWLHCQAFSREAEALIAGQLKGEETALAELGKALNLSPTDKTLLHRAARAARRCAELLRHAERLEPAKRFFGQARGWYERLLALDADNAQCAGELADVLVKETLLDWHVLVPTKMTSAGGANLTKQPDGSVLASGNSPDTDTYTITATTKLKRMTAFRLETLADPTFLNGGPGRIGNFVVTEFEAFLQPPGDAKAHRAELLRALASWEQTMTNGLDGRPMLTAAHAIDGDDRSGWAIWPKVGKPHYLIVDAAQPVADVEQTTLSFVIRQNSNARQHTLGRFRLSATTHPSPLLAELWRPILAQANINGWTKLAAAHYLAGDDQPALRALNKSTAPKGAYESLLRAFVQSRLGQHDPARTGLLEGLAVLSQTGADEALRRLALEAIHRVQSDSSSDVPVLTQRAALLLRQGRREAAAADYAKLAKLEPKNAEWITRLAQFQPETLTSWNFDFDAEDWRPLQNCELTASAGVLLAKNVKGDTRIQVNVAAPAGWKELTLRLRAKNSALGRLLWATTAQADQGVFPAGRFSHLNFSIEPSGDAWQTIKMFFCPDAGLTGLLVELGGANQQIEIDAAQLRSLDVQTALKELTEEIARSKNPSQLLRHRGVLNGSLGQWEAALADFREMSRRNRSGVWPPFYQMLLLGRAGDREGYDRYRREALAPFAKANSGPLVTELTARAALLLSAEGDDLKLATELSDRAMSDQSKSHRRWRQLTKGLAEYRNGRFVSAIEWLEKSRQDASGSGQVAAGSASASETPQLEAQTQLILAMAHHRLGRIDKAREWFDGAAKIIDEQLPKLGSPSLGETWPDWIITHVLRAEAEALVAVDALSQAIRQSPKDVKLLTQRADFLIRLGRREEALADLGKAVELESKDTEQLSTTARRLARLGRREAAAAGYAKLVQLELKNPEWGIRLAQLQPEVTAFFNFDLGDEGWRPQTDCELTVRGGALRVQSTGNDPRIQVYVASPSGCKELTLRLRSAASSAGGLVWTTKMQTVPYVGAAAYRMQNFSIASTNEQWQTIKVYFCHDAELTGLALSLGRGQKELEIDSAWLRSVDADTALKELTQAISDNGQTAELLRSRGTLYASLAQWKEALADFTELKKRDPGTWTPFYNLLLLAQTGERDGYVKYRRERLQQYAKAKAPWLLVAELTARAGLLLPVEGEDAKLAADLADRVLKDENPARLRWRQLTTGLAEYRRQQFDRAIEWLERSRKLPPETPAPHLEAQTLLALAMAHHRLGRLEPARSFLSEASKIVDEQLSKPRGGSPREDWPDWIITNVLRREAEGLIVGESPRAPDPKEVAPKGRK